jgi:hypothetical protein
MKTELTAQFIGFENRLEARIAGVIEEGTRWTQGSAPAD